MDRVKKSLFYLSKRVYFSVVPELAENYLLIYCTKKWSFNNQWKNDSCTLQKEDSQGMKISFNSLWLGCYRNSKFEGTIVHIQSEPARTFTLQTRCVGVCVFDDFHIVWSYKLAIWVTHYHYFWLVLPIKKFVSGWHLREIFVTQMYQQAYLNRKIFSKCQSSSIYLHNLTFRLFEATRIKYSEGLLSETISNNSPLTRVKVASEDGWE